MTEAVVRKIALEDRHGNRVRLWTEVPVFYAVKQCGDYFYIPGNRNFVLAPFELKTFYTKFYSDTDLFPVANWVHKSVKVTVLPIKEGQVIKCQIQNVSGEPVQFASGVCFMAIYFSGGMLKNDEAEVVLNEGVNSEWTAEWEKFKSEFPTVFVEKNRPPGCPVYGLEYWRDVFDGIPLKARPIPVNVYPNVEKAKIEEFLNQEIEAGQMKQVSLDCVKYLTATNFKIKPTGQIRPIFDFRPLNSYFGETKEGPKEQATPHLLSCISELPCFKFALSIDLKSAYHNVKMPEWIIPFFGISHSGFFYELLTLPEGFCLSPQLFHWTLRETLDQHLSGQKFYRYFDDIVILGDSISEIVFVFEKVLNRCESVGFRISEAKCHFTEGYVDWLGYHIKGNGEICPSLKMEKIESVLTKEEDLTLKDMQKIVGAMNRWKIQSFDRSGFSSLISDYLRGSVNKEMLRKKWTDLKENLFYRYRFVEFEEFELAVDWYGSSGRNYEQCGVVFCGLNKSKKKHLLFYTSEKIEGFHSSLLGELMAIHKGLSLIMKGNWLTRSKKISVLSDGKSVTDLLNKVGWRHCEKLDLRVKRRLCDIREWANEMMWNLCFTHIDGVENTFADCLSRVM